MAIAFILITVVITLAIAVILLRQGHPEQTATDREDVIGDSRSERFYSKGVDVAGPDAEAMGVGEPGEPSINPDGATERDNRAT